MRRFLIAICLAASLPLAGGCATIPTGTAQLADQTKVDEQLAIGANLGYKAFRLAVETGVQSGFIKGTLATKVADVDSRLFGLIQTIDSAYKSGNSQSLAGAVAAFNTTLAQGNALITGKGQ